jgi:hypothetical protein
MAKDHDPELEEFKCFDLRVYAASQGYKIGKGKSESSRGSSAMYHDNGDKIIIKRDIDNHYVYFSVHQKHNGTIIDLVQHLKNLSFGRVRQELRPYVGRGQGRIPSSPLPVYEPLPAVPKNLIAVAKEYELMQDTPAHAYLVEVRGIPSALLESERFAGLVRRDQYGNAVFPHFNEKGLCGFEKKNKDFTGFASGGEKGLGISRDFEGDNCIVFTESAVEFLSHAALFQNPRARYRSVGGELNPVQPALIKEAIERMPIGAKVISAMNNDDTGHKLGDVVGQAVLETGRPDLAFHTHEPTVEENDWNEVLKPTKIRPFVFPTAQKN